MDADEKLSDFASDLTPETMKCGPFNCPAVYALEDGRLLIVGDLASSAQTERINIGANEAAVIIDRELLAKLINPDS